jgi:hypothetical protein
MISLETNEIEEKDEAEILVVVTTYQIRESFNNTNNPPRIY